MKVKISYFLILGGWLLACAQAYADGMWTENGNTICAAANEQECPQLVADGSGGAIITWHDNRAGNYDIYAQRVDANGNTQWAVNGKIICEGATSSNQAYPVLAADDSGGAIIVWTDYRSSNWDIYAQRADKDGNLLWTASGITVCDSGGDQGTCQVIRDGAGGAIIVWQDNHDGNFDVYAQRVDSDGNTLWAVNGVAICNELHDQLDPKLISDGLGGAIIVWDDMRDVSGYCGIYAEHVDEDGNILWSPACEGILICNAAQGTDQLYPQLIEDGSNGAIIVWYDKREGNFDIYSQRVDADGNTLWSQNGILVCNAGNDQGASWICGDGAAGAIIVWQDGRQGVSDSDIYAQRVDGNGNPLWTHNGCLICDAPVYQYYPALAADDAGGATIVWWDIRQGNWDVYSQRVDANGNCLWRPNGIVICNEDGEQSYYFLIRDGVGGFIYAWQDKRNGIDYNIFSQKIIRPFPVITGINPSQAPWGKMAQNIAITGYSIGDDKGQVTGLKLTRDGEADILAENVNVTSPTTLTCNFDLAIAALGDWHLTAYDSLGQTSTTLGDYEAVFKIIQPQMQSLQWISAPVGEVYTGTQDNLLGQINCTAAGYDFLKTLAVENTESAAAGTDISGLSLWHKAGGSSSGITFDPLQARRLGNFTAASGEKTWQISLNQEINDNDALYITADISSGAQAGKTIKLRLPQAGASFEYGAALPAPALSSQTEQTIVLQITLRLDMISLAPVNVIRGRASLNLGRIQMTNVSGGTLTINKLLVTLLDQAGTEQELDSVFNRLWLEQGTTTVSELSAPFAGGKLFNFSPSLNLPSQGETRLEFYCDITDNPRIEQFRIGLPHGQCLNSGVFLSGPAENKKFPLLIHPVNIRQSKLPAVFSNYPNPFQAGREETGISYYLKQPARIKLKVWTLSGKLVRTLEDSEKTEGVHEAAWDGRNGNGYWVRSGVYLLRIEVKYAGGGREALTRKVAVVR